jgi:hypothetical protein
MVRRITPAQLSFRWFQSLETANSGGGTAVRHCAHRNRLPVARRTGLVVAGRHVNESSLIVALPLREFRLHRQEKFLYICDLLDTCNMVAGIAFRCRLARSIGLDAPRDCALLSSWRHECFYWALFAEAAIIRTASCLSTVATSRLGPSTRQRDLRGKIRPR